jgi:hypothetical protein
MRPNEIFNILYSEKVFGLSIFHAVLLQEILISGLLKLFILKINRKWVFFSSSSNFLMVFLNYDLGKKKFFSIIKIFGCYFIQ